MTGRQEASGGSSKARGLAPIKQTKTKASIAFAAHLRELRERCGMTSKEAASALGVDESTLSRYMGGDRLPEWQFLTRFHDLCEEQTGEQLSEQVRDASRDLMYAAARSRGGLQGRKLELEIAIEAMKRQEDHTQQLVSDLQEELNLERSHRESIEKQFTQLQQQAHQDAQAAAQELGELAQQRDEALDRIAVLEAALSETEMMLELQRDDREMLSQRSRDTDKKIQEIDNRERSRRPIPPEEDPSKVLCPLCNTYTSANMRWCVRCLGELSTSTPVGTRSPHDPPERPDSQPAHQSLDDGPFGLLGDPLGSSSRSKSASSSGAFTHPESKLPSVDELLRRIQGDRQRRSVPSTRPDKVKMSAWAAPPSKNSVWFDLGRADDERLARSLAAENDPSALIQIMDGYAARLYDYCHALLRDQESAAGALHDALVAACAHVSLLVEPDRFRAWLYALARNECIRRLQDPDRPAERHEAPEVEEFFLEEDERAHRFETRQLVHGAQSGLRGREREVLDLMLRHGLDAVEIAGVLGIDAQEASDLTGEAWARLDDALAAALIARTGRDDCPAVADIVDGLEGWALTPPVLHRLVRHIEACQICTERRVRIAPTERFLQVLPVALMPPDLRGRVLSTTTDPAYSGDLAAIAQRAQPFDAWGWPVPSRADSRKPDRRRRVTDRFKRRP
jgi:RNA polymerase sigma factor (sigma-70 family)